MINLVTTGFSGFMEDADFMTRRRALSMVGSAALGTIVLPAQVRAESGIRLARRALTRKPPSIYGKAAIVIDAAFFAR